MVTTEKSHVTNKIQNSSGPAAEKEYNNYDSYVEPTSVSQVAPGDTLMYNTNEHGERICGAGSCPVRMYRYYSASQTLYSDNIQNSSNSGSGGDIEMGQSWMGGHSGSMPLIIIYIVLAIIALTLTYLSHPMDNTFKFESIKGMTDTLMFAGPMAFFIGTEQGYVLGDFTKVSSNF